MNRKFIHFNPDILSHDMDFGDDEEVEVDLEADSDESPGPGPGTLLVSLLVANS